MTVGEPGAGGARSGAHAGAADVLNGAGAGETLQSSESTLSRIGTLAAAQVEDAEVALAGGIAVIGASLASHTLSQANLTTRQEKMAAEARRKMVLDSQAEVVEGEAVWPKPFHTRLDHFNQYGVGMRLYFDFLLVAGFLLAFLGLAGAPLSLLCFSGRNPRIESFIARFSIGNLGDCGEKGECDASC
jgi:hypothetical protein